MTSTESPTNLAARDVPKEISHTIRIGPSAYYAITKSPSPDPVQIGLAPATKNEADDSYVRIALTNNWNHRIKPWWIRTQVLSRNTATGESEWKVTAEDYPRGNAKANILPGASDTFLVNSGPFGTPWRVSIIYSREVANPPTSTGPVTKFYVFGDFEANSAAMKD